jgi:methyl-accepting chemotaxis protein
LDAPVPRVKKMAGETKTEKKEDEEQSFDLSMLRKLKKPIFFFSIGLSVFGLFLTFILAFLINGSLDTLQKSINPQLEAAGNTLKELETTSGDVAIMIASTNTTLTDVKNTTKGMKTGLSAVSLSMTAFGDTLKTMNFGVISLASYGTQISNAGASLSDAANNIDKIDKDLDAHAASAAQVSTDIENVKNSIRMQRDTLASARSGVDSLLGQLKLANLAGSIVIMLMFCVLILNSLGGMLD